MNFNLFSNLINPLAGDSASAWQELVNKVAESIDQGIGSLLGIFGLLAVVLTIFYAIKGGFANDPSKRKLALIGMGSLWGLVGLALLAWSLRPIIITLVAGTPPSSAPGSFLNLII